MTRLISSVYGFGGNHSRGARSEGVRTRPMPVPLDVIEGLQPAARERGISVPELIQRLLETISADGMVAAVLDDVAELDARKRGER